MDGYSSYHPPIYPIFIYPFFHPVFHSFFHPSILPSIHPSIHPPTTRGSLLFSALNILLPIALIFWLLRRSASGFMVAKHSCQLIFKINSCKVAFNLISSDNPSSLFRIFAYSISYLHLYNDFLNNFYLAFTNHNKHY